MKIVSTFHRIPFTALTLWLAIAPAVPVGAEPYIPPTGLSAPARRESAGTRGCVFGNPANVVALMPATNVGWTTEAYPQFYWYLPTNQASFIEFRLEKPAAEPGTAPTLVYQARFAVLGENGIIRLQVPENANIPPLEVGDRYRWQVSVFCNPNSSNGDLQVDGWVERQLPNPELTAALETASATEQAALYARHGFWFNATDQFINLAVNDPENPEVYRQWQEFLDSVGLGSMADQPLLTYGTHSAP